MPSVESQANKACDGTGLLKPLAAAVSQSTGLMRIATTRLPRTQTRGHTRGTTGLPQRALQGRPRAYRRTQQGMGQRYRRLLSRLARPHSSLHSCLLTAPSPGSVAMQARRNLQNVPFRVYPRSFAVKHIPPRLSASHYMIPIDGLAPLPYLAGTYSRH